MTVHRKTPAMIPFLNKVIHLSSGTASNIFLVLAVQYATLHAQLNALMAQRKMQNLDKRNILFISIHQKCYVSVTFLDTCMMTKKRRTIVLAFLLLEEEEASEYKTHETKKGSWYVQSWIQRREEKDC